MTSDDRADDDRTGEQDGHDEQDEQTGQAEQTGPEDPLAGAEYDAEELAEAADRLEELLLGESPSLNRRQVSEQAGVPLEMSQQLWRLLGFARTDDEEVAFTPADVEALTISRELIEQGIIDADSQAALVRTWGRSFARLAEWQTTLLAGIAVEQGSEPAEAMTELADDVLPRIDRLQSYVWRRHLASAGNRLLTMAAEGGTGTLAVCFVDIVGYTSQSRGLDESELVGWIEYFEDQCAGMAVDAGGRIIKNIGDEVLLVADDARTAAELALAMVERGADDDDDFPQVRAGVAYGEVVSRLGDVFGPTVNIASRLTSEARPGTVLVDEGVHDALCREHDEQDRAEDDPDAQPDDRADDRSEGRAEGRGDAGEMPYRLKRVRRLSVKGYSRLPGWRLRHR